MEAGFFRRALASARSLESAVPEGSWPVYNPGRQVAVEETIRTG